MNEAQILERLTRIVREVFEDDTIRISRKTALDDIVDWNSLEHITLIEAVEKGFGIRFRMQEVSTIRNIGEMVDIIEARMK